MPVWFFAADLFNERLTQTNIPGRWLYVSIIFGAAICGIAISFLKFAVWQRMALVFASWLLIFGEVLMLGTFFLSRSGLKGTQ
jgi:hypothetical protein